MVEPGRTGTDQEVNVRSLNPTASAGVVKLGCSNVAFAQNGFLPEVSEPVSKTYELDLVRVA